MQPEQFIKRLNQLQGSSEFVPFILSSMYPILQHGNFTIREKSFSGEFEDEQGTHILKMLILQEGVEFCVKVISGSMKEMHCVEHHQSQSGFHYRYDYCNAFLNQKLYDVKETSVTKQFDIYNRETSHIMMENHCQYSNKNGILIKLSDVSQTTSYFRGFNNMVLEKQEKSIYNSTDHTSQYDEKYFTGYNLDANSRDITFGGFFHHIDKEQFEQYISSIKGIDQKTNKKRYLVKTH